MAVSYTHLTFQIITAMAAANRQPIRLALYAQNGFVMLRVENYCAAPVELDTDGLPVRSSHCLLYTS